MAFYHCPFCPFSNDDSSFLIQHVELSHPENADSPFVCEDDVDHVQARQTLESMGGSKGPPSTGGYIECECGETVLLSEFSSHSDLHIAEGMAFEDTEEIEQDTEITMLADEQRTDIGRPSPPPAWPSDAKAPSYRSVPILTTVPRSRDTPRRHANGVRDLANALFGSSQPTPRVKARKKKHSSPQRLGISDLGPHAYEEEMPPWLRRQLERGAKVTVLNKISADGRLLRRESIANETRGILPVLSQLYEQDRSLSKVYLCHPDVLHVVKMAKEGGFCGYRNIQMMISFIQGAKAQGHEKFPGRLPSILELQDLIERAWDLGFNSSGRIETGGIRGTRKFIGTPEAHALMQSMNIHCDAIPFIAASEDEAHNESPPTYHRLYRYVEQYFSAGTKATSETIYRTSLPPLYFQHPGHSLTIIGLEKRKNGLMNLLVFDPMFKTSPGILRLVDTRFRTTAPDKLLKAYRRGDTYLGRHKCFELLSLTPHVPPKVGWDHTG